MEALLSAVDKTNTVASTSLQGATPSFVQFDPSSELWTDYWARFCTFVSAHSVSNDRKAQIFLTNQSSTTYKLLSNLASQETPPKSINELTMTEIETYMKHQFDPKRFVVRERFKFWSEMQRKPGESVLELAARIRQAAATCNFTAIKDPLDEALRTLFIFSINNEAVLKALFKVKDDELTFSRAVEIAVETEDAAKVAKETVYGSKPTQSVHKVTANKFSKQTASNSKDSGRPKVKCFRCGKTNHVAPDCRFKDAVCNFCKITGHLEKVCRKKTQQSTTSPVKAIDIQEVNSIANGVTSVPKLEVVIAVNDTKVTVELDTATAANFLSLQGWQHLGKPQLCKTLCKFQSASKHDLPVRGSFEAITSYRNCTTRLIFMVTEVPGLNLLGRDAIKALGITVDNFFFSTAKAISSAEIDRDLQSACSKLCDDYADLFKPELGCLRDVELEIEFKSGSKPIFMKSRPVPFAIQDDLARAYDAGIARGVWTPTQFNDWGTPVVPIRKPPLPGDDKPKLRVCGDYSATVNPQLAVHRHPLPLPEELMRKLGGGYGFTKIDLADAYNQVRLSPESRKRLALSTHRGVLLQNVLPFGISSAPGYFQKIMDDLTSDLPGVAVYLDDILVSGKDAKDHYHNLQRPLDRLHDKGLRC